MYLPSSRACAFGPLRLGPGLCWSGPRGTIRTSVFLRLLSASRQDAPRGPKRKRERLVTVTTGGFMGVSVGLTEDLILESTVKKRIQSPPSRSLHEDVSCFIDMSSL